MEPCGLNLTHCTLDKRATIDWSQGSSIKGTTYIVPQLTRQNQLIRIQKFNLIYSDIRATLDR